MNYKWFYSLNHRQLCKVIDTQTLWGETYCHIWLPERNTIVRIPASNLRPLNSSSTASPDYISYVAYAARIADALAQDILLAPIESSVIPLPHQLYALSRAISGDRVRYLLADEVGLGKTIEAGLIMRELKLRGLVTRTLVIAPKGLVQQWVSEMRFHFGETFQLVLPEDIKSLRRIVPITETTERNPKHHAHEIQSANPWQMFSQVVVPMDSVKPLDRRRGWTLEQVSEHNRERFDDLISAGWDLIIVDEAHRLGGSTDQVARYKLGQGLAEAAPYVLLLTATPHQGKTDSFHRLISLLDAQAFPDSDSISCERVQPYVIRTEKRTAIDADGKPLFKPRYTQLAPISWEERHKDQKLLYEAVTDYVREGYNQAMKDKQGYIGFLLILMQRLVVSSTRAIRTTLEKRLAVLEAPQEQLTLFPLSDEEWADLDGQEQVDLLVHSRIKALRNERAEVKTLLELASRCEQKGPDAKAEALIEWIYRLQSQESDPEFKVLIFTEFVPTQEMLQQFLSERGFSVVCLNGSMNMEERKRIQEAFAKDVRILISTEAGGEGLNLQFCHVVINYDIPWNPMRLEQRIGRVDRIGQHKPVRAINFVFEDSVEYRVLEVLEQKLAVILEEFGVDKTSDVLDSAQAGHMFDEMYVKAILNPENIAASVESVIAHLQEQTREAKALASVLGSTRNLEPGEARRLLAHPLPYWVERMTVSYLRSHGGQAEKNNGWNLTWPDGETNENVVFSSKEAELLPTAYHCTLEDPKVRSLVMMLPMFVPGQPIPILSIPGLAEEIKGFWSLWHISILSQESEVASRFINPPALYSESENRRRRIMPLFVADTGMVYMPTARYVWDQLLTTSAQVDGMLDQAVSESVFDTVRRAAEEYGEPLYQALLQEHRRRISREREKASYAFAARRKMLERIGLPQVRTYRLNLLAQEERTFQEKLEKQAHVLPDMQPLLVIRLGSENHAELA